MESSRVLIDKTQRCPFCHETVALESDWLACRQCLARHHSACWRETSKCASCQGDQALVTGSSAPLPRGEDALDALRRETARTAAEAAHRDERTASLLLGLATFGVQPFVDATLSFATHAQDGDDRGDVFLRVERARLRASEARAGSRVLLVVVPFLVLAPLMGVWAAGTIQVIGAWLGHASAPFEDPAFPFVYLLQLVLWLPAFIFLHVFREVVRRHELHQAFARLVADAVPPLVVADYLGLTTRRWNLRRSVDLALTALGVVPFVGVLAVVMAGVRTRGALALHEDDELLLPRRSAPVPVKC